MAADGARAQVGGRTQVDVAELRVVQQLSGAEINGNRTLKTFNPREKIHRRILKQPVHFIVVSGSGNTAIKPKNAGNCQSIYTIVKKDFLMTTQTLDLSGLKCPLPVLRTKKALAALQSGDVLTVLVTDAGAPDDFAAFCRHTGHTLLQSESSADGVFTLVVRCK